MIREAYYCPLCGAALEMRERFDKVRPVCPNCNHTVFFDPKVAVVVRVLQDEQILLVKRAGDPKKGFWALPAGFVEWDEDPKIAAQREVLEETGLEVQIDQLIDVFHTPDDGGAANIVIAYGAKVTGGKLCAADDAEAVGWFRREELPELAFIPSQRLAARWAANDT